MLAIEFPYPQFFDLDGRPLDGGYVYIGQEWQNPLTAPVPVYWDAALTQPAAQPIRTKNGLLARNGTPANVFTAGEYSLTVQNSQRKQVLYAKSSSETGVEEVPDSLRTELASGEGSGIVGFVQIGTGAVERTVLSKLREVAVSIQDYGGRDDDITDNSGPFLKALAAHGAGFTLRFPRTSLGGKYFFENTIDLGAVVLDPDVGVSFRGPIAGYNNTRTTRDIPLRQLNDNFNWSLTTMQNKPFVEKGLWMGDGDIDHSVAQPINCAGLQHERLVFGSGDTWLSAASDVTAAVDRVTWNALPNDGQVRMSFLDVRPGDELSVAFQSAGGYHRCAMLKTSRGVYWVTGQPADVPRLGGKIIGAAAYSSPFGYSGSAAGTAQPSYDPSNAHWSIRVYDRKHFAVLFNGVEVSGVVETDGEIVSAGFGVLPTVAGADYAVIGWVRRRNIPHSGKKDIRVLAMGDSMTAAGMGAWVQHMREAMDASYGCRITHVENIAVSGDNTGDAIQRLNAMPSGAVGYNYAFVFLGTNDIQGAAQLGQLALNNLIVNMTTICNKIVADGCVPILWICPLWYRQTDVNGDGVASTNHELGAALRMTMLRFAADRGFKVVDMTQVLGPILPSYYLTETTAGAGSILRDNIHASTYGNRLIGWAAARALAGAMTRKFDRSLQNSTIDSAWMKNGWTSTIQPATYSLSSDGLATLGGVLNGGTEDNGTSMVQLPRHLMPLATCRFLCASSLTTPVLVQINPDGQMLIYNAAGATFVALDGITYQTGG